MPKTELTLYHYWRSSSSWRVRWGLNLKKVAFTSVPVNLLTGEEKSGAHAARNPAKYVPTIECQGEFISESLAILEWLEESYPTPSFFIGDAFQRAKIRQFAEVINAGIQPLHNMSVIRAVSDDKAKQEAWTKGWIERGLSVCEELLADSKTKYAYADFPTLADICLIPQCYSALRFGVDLAAYPRCRAIYEFALATPECAAAHPDRFQPPA